MSETIRLEGHTFTLPSPSISIASDGCYALAFFTSNAVCLDEDLLEMSLDPGAIDLGLVRAGRCPLLAEHSRRLENLLGRVIAVAADGQIMRAVVQFAHGPEPDRLWAMVEAGFPLSLSVGGTINHAKVVEESPGRSRLYRATHWTLNELSIVVYGKDREAHVRRLRADEDLARHLREMQEASDEGRAAVRATLRLDRWDRWAVPASLRIADRLGIDGAAVCDALAAEVKGHGDVLVADLAT